VDGDRVRPVIMDSKRRPSFRQGLEKVIRRTPSKRKNPNLGRNAQLRSTETPSKRRLKSLGPDLITKLENVIQAKKFEDNQRWTTSVLLWDLNVFVTRCAKYYGMSAVRILAKIVCLFRDHKIFNILASLLPGIDQMRLICKFLFWGWKSILMSCLDWKQTVLSWKSRDIFSELSNPVVASHFSLRTNQFGLAFGEEAVPCGSGVVRVFLGQVNFSDDRDLCHLVSCSPKALRSYSDEMKQTSCRTRSDRFICWDIWFRVHRTDVQMDFCILFARVSQPEPPAPIGGHGAVLRGSRAEAFTK